MWYFVWHDNWTDDCDDSGHQWHGKEKPAEQQLFEFEKCNEGLHTSAVMSMKYPYSL